jgi:hypothetical protein
MSHRILREPLTMTKICEHTQRALKIPKVKARDDDVRGVLEVRRRTEEERNAEIRDLQRPS